MHKRNHACAGYGKWHLTFESLRCVQPYPVLAQAVAGGKSTFNEEEAQVAAAVVDALLREGTAPGDIGVVTPYAAQVGGWVLHRFATF